MHSGTYKEILHIGHIQIFFKKKNQLNQSNLEKEVLKKVHKNKILLNIWYEKTKTPLNLEKSSFPREKHTILIN